MKVRHALESSTVRQCYDLARSVERGRRPRKG